MKIILGILLALGLTATSGVSASEAPDSIAADLTSGDFRRHEIALKQIISGQGQLRHGLLILAAVKKQDLRTGGARHLAPLVIEALAKLGQQDPQIAAENIYLLVSFSSAYRNPAVKQLLRMPEQLVAIIIGVVRNPKPRHLTFFMELARVLPPNYVQFAFPALQLALKSEEYTEVFGALEAIIRQFQTGTPKATFFGFRPQILALLNDPRWDAGTLGDLPDTAIPVFAALVASELFGKDDGVYRAVQGAFGRFRAIGGTREINYWRVAINLASGVSGPATERNGVQEIRNYLQAIYAFRTGNGQAGDEFQMAGSGGDDTASLIGSLPLEEAEELITRFLTIPGQTEFRKALARRITDAEEFPGFAHLKCMIDLIQFQ